MKIYNQLFQEFKSQYMMMMPLTIIFQSCFGSVVAMYILQNKGDFMLLHLGICIMVTMLFNAAILAQIKPDIVFKLLFVSLLVNCLILFL